MVETQEHIVILNRSSGLFSTQPKYDVEVHEKNGTTRKDQLDCKQVCAYAVNEVIVIVSDSEIYAELGACLRSNFSGNWLKDGLNHIRKS